MPLLDHFTVPVPLRQRWESFRMYWAAMIGSHLNDLLPERFYAAVQQHHGSRIEADVLEYDMNGRDAESADNGGLAVQTYAPPRTTGTFPAIFPDEIEIPVIDLEDSGKLAGVIELVGPSNKHDPASRRTFAGKCASYLANGIGLIIVDLVSNKRFDLHDELIDLLGHASELQIGTCRYATAYRPVRRGPDNVIDFWASPMEIGEPLPTLPFALKGWERVPLHLEETYNDTCRMIHLTM